MRGFNCNNSYVEKKRVGFSTSGRERVVKPAKIHLQADSRGRAQLRVD